MRNTTKIVLLVAGIFVLILLFGAASAGSTGDLTVQIANLPDDGDAYVSLSPDGVREKVDEGGTATFEGLEPGTYKVRASHNGSASEQKAVTVEADSVTRATFKYPFDSQDPLNPALVDRKI